jgi:lipopolysaccharide biosynthesis glycosyltransferase
MKNLIYFISNKKYKDVLQYNIENINRLHNDIDICCIADKDLNFDSNETKPNFVYYIDNFDYRYTAKYIIFEWEKSNQYDNFLYLDTDSVVTKNILEIFSIIENNKNIIHGTKEGEYLNTTGSYHKFTDKVYEHNPPFYNAGIFGFNKMLLSTFPDFITYINTNKNSAFIDQALFNEYFAGEKNLLQNTLEPFVHLFTQNKTTRDLFKNAHIIHFLGGMYDGKSVNCIKEIFAAHEN